MDKFIDDFEKIPSELKGEIARGMVYFMIGYGRLLPEKERKKLGDLLSSALKSSKETSALGKKEPSHHKSEVRRRLEQTGEKITEANLDSMEEYLKETGE